jgi:hypothetical protein
MPLTKSREKAQLARPKLWIRSELSRRDSWPNKDPSGQAGTSAKDGYDCGRTVMQVRPSNGLTVVSMDRIRSEQEANKLDSKTTVYAQPGCPGRVWPL